MTRTDRYVLLALAFSMLLLLILRPLALGRGNARFVQVEVGGRVVRRLALLPGDQRQEVPVEIPGGQAVLSFEQGGVRIEPMPRDLCPRGICSHSGLIRRPGATLICAPNRLVVKVTGGPAAVDAVAR